MQLEENVIENQSEQVLSYVFDEIAGQARTPDSLLIL